jgi:serine/threonine protein kinase/Flp pilus assembly protein TadD
VNVQRWEQIQAGFDELVQQDPSARALRLTAIASTDPELHRALESMLASDSGVDVQLASIESAFLPPCNGSRDPLRISGRTISHFVVHEALGAGGMGVVYRAEDTRLGRAVALKFLLPHYSLDSSAKARFVREAHTAAALDHPNLCAIHEVGATDEGWMFLAMALCEGETLRARLARDGSLVMQEALEIARQIAEGLQAAHAESVVHRDLKPANVMLLPDGTVRILDFGLAKARDQSLTETGAHFGTVSYMSPAQARGEQVDGRADLWALGVVLYEMLTGQKPFRGAEDVAIAHAILHDTPEPPSTLRADLSAPVESLVLRLLQKDPAKRYATASELLHDLVRVRTRGERRLDALQMRWRRAMHAATTLAHSTTGRALFTVAFLTIVTVAGWIIVRSPLAHASEASRSPANPEANRLYVLGRFFFEKKDSASFTRAQEYFRLAIEKDSAFAPAYAGLAEAYSQQATYGFAQLAGNFAKANEYASRALVLDSTLAEAHVSLGFIALFYKWDWARAGRELAAAVRLDNGRASAHLFRAWYFMATDSVNAGIEEGRKAADLEPVSPLNTVRLVGFLFYGKRYDEALAKGQEAFDRDSSFSTLRQELARIYVELGRCTDALAILQSSVDQHVAALGGVRGYAYAHCGHRAEALAERARLGRQSRITGHVSPYALAVIDAGLGRTDDAIAELQQAYAERVWAMYMIRLEPAFDVLRTDPRFVAIVRRMNFVSTPTA